MRTNGYILDFKQLYEMSEGDSIFYFNILKMLKATCEEGYEKLDKSFQNKNYIRVAEQAHKLCSTFTHLNAADIQHDLHEIEDKCRSTTNGEISEGIDKTWMRLKNTLKKCMSEIDNEIDMY